MGHWAAMRAWQGVRQDVARIRVVPETVWPNGRTTPEREAYPGASSWGRLGFTCFTLEEAQTLAAGLQAQAVPLEQGEEDAGEPTDTPQPGGEQA